MTSPYRFFKLSKSLVGNVLSKFASSEINAAVVHALLLELWHELCSKIILKQLGGSGLDSLNLRNSTDEKEIRYQQRKAYPRFSMKLHGRFGIIAVCF